MKKHHDTCMSGGEVADVDCTCPLLELRLNRDLTVTTWVLHGETTVEEFAEAVRHIADRFESGARRIG